MTYWVHKCVKKNFISAMGGHFKENIISKNQQKKLQMEKKFTFLSEVGKLALVVQEDIVAKKPN